MPHSNPPEPGQIVEVRHLRFVVTDVARGALPDGALASGHEASEHLVTLSSVEDDALGEELQVVWELEPGARLLDDVNLPELTAFDAPQRLDAFLDAVCWGAASSADVRALQAPFRSGVDIEEYQLDPAVRALQMPRVNLLIADDVGLGKTIEAGLVMQELLIRHRARRVLIICPAALQIHWHEQMRDKFGLEFRIVDSALMKQLRRDRGLHVNPWTHFPRLITSVDFLKRDRPLRLFRDTLPSGDAPRYPRRYDLLIVDEAHNVAPSGRGRYAVDSQRTQAIRLLAPHFEHRLFLTATPHNGYLESFTALLELVDNQRFARGVEPDPAQKQAIMVRRLKSELRDDLGQSVFPPRKLVPLEVAYTEREREAHRWLQEYARLCTRRVGLTPGTLPLEINGAEPAAAERFAIAFVLKLLKKRLFSSPAAFRSTLEQHRRWLRGDRASESGLERRATLGQLRQMISQVEEEYAEDNVAEEAEQDAIGAASRIWHSSPEEMALLDKLSAWAEQAASRADSKTQRLIDWLQSVVKPDGAWSDARVILFTEYRATQIWLQELLAASGLAGNERLLTLYGGMIADQREEVKAAFQADPAQSPVRILLATDAASEGIDLQRHCHRLVHIEIPWNPNRMEQRIGRIDRHGQKFSPEVYHFVADGYQQNQRHAGASLDVLDADLEFLMRVAVKIDQIRSDLGSVGSVIADQVTQAMLGGERRLETADAERRAGPARRQLKFERDLRAQITRLSEQLRESRQTLRLYPGNVQQVVATALELAGQPPLRPAALEGAPAGSVFAMPTLSGSWARAIAGLHHPYTGAMRPLTFDADVAKGRDDVVLVHLNHILVQMSMRLLRAEVWAFGAGKRLNRAAVRIVPSHALAHPVVVAHARLVIVGSDGQRLHEELLEAGGEIVEGRFRRFNQTQMREAQAAATTRPATALLQNRLIQAWADVRPGVVRALEVRQQERTTSLAERLAERVAREQADITTVLRELERAIRAELATQEVTQLELWPKAERDQLQRNEDALRRRLEQIPQEIELEVAQIAACYANHQVRLFPVAVTFLAPERMNP